MTGLSAAFLTDWRERMRQDMLMHPQHHLNWRLRREFYLELGNDTAFKRQFRGWLAVLCVQKVLPVLLCVCPHAPDIFDELSACLSHLRGEESPHSLRRLLDGNYHGHWHPVIDLNGQPLHNAIAVGMSSFRAMQEIRNWDEEYGWLDPFRSARFVGRDGKEVPDTTDEFWIHSAGVGDAASAAAVAFACSADSTTCHPEKLKTFWTWWLDEAWPTALKLAERYEESDKRAVPPPAEETPDSYAEMRPEPFGADDWPDAEQ